MKELINKVKFAIAELENEYQPLSICALFLREEPFEIWDIVISAPWLDSKKIESCKLVTSKLLNYLNNSDLLQVSGVVLLDQDDPTVEYLLGLKTIDNGGFHELRADELTDRFKFVIKKAYLLRSQVLTLTQNGTGDKEA